MSGLVVVIVDLSLPDFSGPFYESIQKLLVDCVFQKKKKKMTEKVDKNFFVEILKFSDMFFFQ